METFRTFIGVPLPVKLRRELGKFMDHFASDGDGVKWVPPEILHLTLKFLGEVDNVQSVAVCRMAARACRDIEPFDVDLAGTSALPSEERPRSLIIAVNDSANNLHTIVSRLEDGFAEMGFKREIRDYVPHLTLGRTRGGSRRVSGEVMGRWQEEAEREFGKLSIDQIEVVASFLDKAGIQYQTLQTINL